MGQVDLRGVCKTFRLRTGGATTSFAALQDVDFTVGDGEVVALIGPSGCGKTTALRVVMGLEQATAGAVTVDGAPVRGCGHDRGMVFQQAQLLPWLTARQNVQFGLEMKGVSGAALRETTERFLHLVGLEAAANRRPHQLSGGMQQRVGIARALAIDPKVLLMDEPFSALDAQTREVLQGELLRIQGETGKTVLFVTHDLDEAVLLADRAVVMRAGRVERVLDIGLPRPRGDLGALRGTDAFATARYDIWRAMHGVH